MDEIFAEKVIPADDSVRLLDEIIVAYTVDARFAYGSFTVEVNTAANKHIDTR